MADENVFNFVEKAAQKSEESAADYLQTVDPDAIPDFESNVKPRASEDFDPFEIKPGAGTEDAEVPEKPWEEEVEEHKARMLEPVSPATRKAYFATGKFTNLANAFHQAIDQGWGRGDRALDDLSAMSNLGYEPGFEEARALEEENRVDYNKVLGGWSWLHMTAEQGADISRFVWEGKEGGGLAVGGLLTANTIASLSGVGAISWAGTPVSLPTAFGLGVTGDAALTYEFPTQAGETFRELYFAKDIEGNRIDPESARNAAITIAALNTTVEVVGLHAVAKLIPGLEKFAAMPTKKLSKILMKDKTMQKMFKEMDTSTIWTSLGYAGVKGAAITAIETAEEGVNATISTLGHVAAAEANADFNLPTRIGEQTAEALPVTTVFGVMGGLANFTARERSRRKGAKIAKARTSDLVDVVSEASDVEGADTTQLASLMVAEGATNMLDGVDIEVDEVRKLFQTDDEIFSDDPYGLDIANNYPHLNKAIEKAENDGTGSLDLSQPEVFVELTQAATKANKLEELKDSFAFQGSPTAKHYDDEDIPWEEEGTDEAADFMEGMEENTPRQKLLEDITVAKGAKEAKAVIRIYDAFFTRLSEVTGYSVEKLYADNRVLLEKETLDRTPEPLTKLRALVSEVRRGAVIEDRTIYGASLLEYVKSIGGIKDPDVMESYGGTLGAAPKHTWDRIEEMVRDEGYPPPTEGPNAEFDAEGNAIWTSRNIREVLDNEIDNGVRYDKGDVFDEAKLKQREVGNQLLQRMLDLGLDVDSYKKDADLYAAYVKAEMAAEVESGFDSIWLTEADRGKKLKQDDKTVTRGFMQRIEEGFKVTLTKHANRTTTIHESAHVFLEILNDYSRENDQIAEELGYLAQWAGFEVGEKTIPTEAHEKVARGFEKYLMEGKAPIKALEAVFEKFKKWFLHAYSKAMRSKLELSDEAREFFNLMLTSERLAIEAKYDFEMGKVEGLPELMDAEGRALVETAMREAANEIRAMVMRDLNKESEAERKQRRIDLTETVTQEIEAQRRKDPVAGLALYLSGKETDIDKKYGDNAKLNAPLMKAHYATAQGLARVRHMMTNKDAKPGEGIPPETVAKDYGFDSIEDMVNQLTSITPMAQEVKAEVERRLAREFSTEGIEVQADMIMAEKTSEITLYAWTRIFSSRSKQRAPVLSDITSRYRKQIRKKAIGFVKPDMYLRAYKKAIRTMNDALADPNNKDYAKALKASQDAHFAMTAYKEALNVVRFRNTLPKRLNKYYKKSRQDALRRASTGEINYHNVMFNFLNSFDFKQKKLKDLNPNQNLQRLDKFLNDSGELRTIGDVPLLEEFQDEIPNFKELSYEQLKEIAGFADRIYKEAKAYEASQTAERLAAREATIEEMKESIDENMYALERATTDVEGSIQTKILNQLNKWFGEITKLEGLLKIADGGKVGIWYKNIYGWTQEAANARDDMANGPIKDLEDAATRLNQAVAASKEGPSALSRRMNDLALGADVEFLGKTMSKAQVLSIALNVGTLSNREKLVNGYAALEGYERWSEDAVMAELDRVMTKADWRYVTDTWKAVNRLKNPIKKFTEKVLLKDFVEVEGVAIQTKHGVIKGMYYPVVYDRGLTSANKDRLKDANGGYDAAVKNIIESTKDPADAMQAAKELVRVGTGVTMERTSVVAPLLLDLSVAHTHIEDSAHMVTHYEKVVEADKLLRALEDTMTNYFGKEVYQTFKAKLLQVATNRRFIGEAGSIDDLLDHIASATTIFHLGWNPVSAAKNYYGLVNAATDTKGKYIRRAVREMLANPTASMDKAREMSGFMKNYEANFDVNIREFTRKLHKSRFDGAVIDIREGSFLMIMAVQRQVSMTVWHARYQQGIEEHNNQARAVEEADSAVRLTQGSGQIHDLSYYQSRRGFYRLAALFSTPLSAFASKILNTGLRVRHGDRGVVAHRAAIEKIKSEAEGRALTAEEQANIKVLEHKLANAEEKIYTKTKGFYELMPLLILMPMVDALFRTAWQETDDSEEEEFWYRYMRNSLTSSVSSSIGTIPGLGSLISSELYTGQFRGPFVDYSQSLYGGATSLKPSGLLTAIGLGLKLPTKMPKELAEEIEEYFDD